MCRGGDVTSGFRTAEQRIWVLNTGDQWSGWTDHYNLKCDSSRRLLMADGAVIRKGLARDQYARNDERSGDRRQRPEI